MRDFNENIVESINIGVFALDLEDRIESWNAQMEVMHGTPRARLCAAPPREVFSPEFAEELERLARSTASTRSTSSDCTLPTGEAAHRQHHRRAAAESRLWRPSAASSSSTTSPIASAWKRSSRQADKLSSIGLLAAGVAHEVNTPLAVISSYTQMLGKQMRMDETAQARLGPVIEKITQQTFRASEIVNGLLNFSRMSTVDFARVDLNSIVAGNTSCCWNTRCAPRE